MNPSHLQAFLAVQRHLNFTRAAEELFLTQPAVSRQVRQLEDGLGVALFERIGKAVHLTEAGRRFVVEAERVLGAIDRAAEVARASRDPERGHLRIGASTTPGYYLLPPRLRELRDRFPHAQVSFTVANSRDIQRMLVRNEIDLGYLGESPDSEELVVRAVVTDEIVCFAAPEHPLARRRRVGVAALSEQTWVIRERGSATRELFEAWLRDAGGAIGDAIEIGSSEALKLLVDAGLGISFMSVLGLRRDLADGRFRRLRVDGLQLERPIYLARHADKVVSPVARAFIDLVGSAGDLRRRAGRATV